MGFQELDEYYRLKKEREALVSANLASNFPQIIDTPDYGLVAACLYEAAGIPDVLKRYVELRAKYGLKCIVDSKKYELPFTPINVYSKRTSVVIDFFREGKLGEYSKEVHQGFVIEASPDGMIVVHGDNPKSSQSGCLPFLKSLVGVNELTGTTYIPERAWRGGPLSIENAIVRAQKNPITVFSNDMSNSYYG